MGGIFSNGITEMLHTQRIHAQPFTTADVALALATYRRKKKTFSKIEIVHVVVPKYRFPLFFVLLIQIIETQRESVREGDTHCRPP